MKYERVLSWVILCILLFFSRVRPKTIKKNEPQETLKCTDKDEFHGLSLGNETTAKIMSSKKDATHTAAS